ncbi:MAG: signal peptidase II [Cyanophyceae cyanobacterium]
MPLRNPWFWIAAIASYGLDRATKEWIVHHFALKETLPLWPEVFHLTYVTNPGAAFSILQGWGGLRWLSLGVSVALMALAWFGPKLVRREQVGYGLVLGGALGNGLDRFLTGEVVDFFDLRLIRFPIFNVADISINLGILCLIWVMWQQSRSERSH